jgi:hypothetical protein
VHTERFEHLRSRFEPDHLALLADRQRGQKDRDDPILPEGDAELRMSGDLKDKIAVAAFVKKLSLG